MANSLCDGVPQSFQPKRQQHQREVKEMMNDQVAQRTKIEGSKWYPAKIPVSHCRDSRLVRLLWGQGFNDPSKPELDAEKVQAL